MYKADNTKIRCIKDNINEILDICINSENVENEDTVKKYINVISIKARSMKTILNELDKEHHIYNQLATLKDDMATNVASDSEDFEDYKEAIANYLHRIIDLEYYIDRYFEGE